MNIDSVVEVFRQHGEVKQRKLIAGLAKHGRDSFPLLKAVYEGEYPPAVKRWAVEAMGSFPSPDALKMLRSALKNPYMSLRLHALIGISRRGNRADARYIKPILRDESGGIRINALEMIALHRPRWLRSELRRLVNDEKWYIRSKAKKLLDAQ